MGDHPGERGGRCRQLGRNTASPEYGDFLGPNGYRVSEIRFVQIADPDFFRISQVNRGAMGEMETGGCLDGPYGLCRCQMKNCSLVEN